MPRNSFKPTHGMHGTATYKSWEAMKARCLNASHKSYPDYGGRGIQVCEQWRDSFAAFLADMGERPAGTTLDRWPDTNGNYEPANCRWATRQQQQRNTTSNILVTFEGETKTQAEWAERQGIKQTTLSYRLRSGWTPLEALSLVPRLGLKRAPPERSSNGQFSSKFGDEVPDERAASTQEGAKNG